MLRRAQWLELSSQLTWGQGRRSRTRLENSIGCRWQPNSGGPSRDESVWNEGPAAVKTKASEDYGRVGTAADWAAKGRTVGREGKTNSWANNSKKRKQLLWHHAGSNTHVEHFQGVHRGSYRNYSTCWTRSRKKLLVFPLSSVVSQLDVAAMFFQWSWCFFLVFLPAKKEGINRQSTTNRRKCKWPQTTAEFGVLTYETHAMCIGSSQIWQWTGRIVHQILNGLANFRISINMSFFFQCL